MNTATRDDVAFWACMICSAVWAASSLSVFGNIFSAVWMAFGVLIRISAKRDARRMREQKDGMPGAYKV